MMKRVYHPYWLWEDYKNGMWNKIPKSEEDEILNLAIQFTSNYKEYGSAMIEVVECWPYTMEHNLTNPSINYKAFIGHCACCYKFGWPEYLVRLAWRELTTNQQNLANNEADRAYKYWNKKQGKRVQQNMGEPMLFEWDT